MAFGPLEWLFLIASPFVGSYLGVLILRLPEGEDVLIKRSHCCHCKTPLKPLDLVPLISWLALKGKCRHCGAKVSAFYLGIEIAALITTVWAALITTGAAFAVTAVLGWWLLALGVIDYRKFILPDTLTLPLIPVGMAVYYYFDPSGFVASPIGAALGGGGLYLVSIIYKRLRGREGLGLGDVKLMAGIGALTGWMGLSTVLLWAVPGGVFFTMIKLFQGKTVSAKTRLPFGTFLSLGVWLTWLYGPIIVY